MKISNRLSSMFLHIWTPSPRYRRVISKKTGNASETGLLALFPYRAVSFPRERHYEKPYKS